MAAAVVGLTSEGVDTRQDVKCSDVLRILKEHNSSHGGVIAVLDAIQARYGYLPEKALRIVSEYASRPLVDVYAVATFYRSFSLKPRGRHLVLACLGTACHVRGAPRTVEELERQLGIKSGETTPDGEFTLETVNCLGACALGPVVVIDGRCFSKVRRPKVRQLLDEARKGSGRVETAEDPRLIPVEVSCPRCGHSLMDDSLAIDGCSAIRLNASFDQTDTHIRLSSLYGSNKFLAEREIPLDAVVTFICPHCRESLNGSPECLECGAPMARMTVQGGGVLQICARWGCNGRMLDLV